MQSLKLVAVIVTACMLSACQQGAPVTGATNSGGIKQNTGATGGTVVNSAPTANSLATPPSPVNPAPVSPLPVGGALLGSMLNSPIVKSLDNADLAAYDATSQHALETGQPGQTMPWRNPQSGNSGTITPQNYSQNSTGQYCREYSQSIVVGAQKQDGYGKACRQPNGTWQLVQ